MRRSSSTGAAAPVPRSTPAPALIFTLRMPVLTLLALTWAPPSLPALNLAPPSLLPMTLTPMTLPPPSRRLPHLPPRAPDVGRSSWS